MVGGGGGGLVGLLHGERFCGGMVPVRGGRLAFLQVVRVCVVLFRVSIASHCCRRLETPNPAIPPKPNPSNFPPLNTSHPSILPTPQYFPSPKLPTSSSSPVVATARSSTECSSGSRPLDATSSRELYQKPYARNSSTFWRLMRPGSAFLRLFLMMNVG